MLGSFIKSIFKIFSFPETIKPAAAFKATDFENSLVDHIYL